MGTINVSFFSSHKSFWEENKNQHVSPLVEPHISFILRTETQCGGNQKTDYASAPPLCVLARSFFLLVERPPLLSTAPEAKPLETRTERRLVPVQRLNMQTTHLNLARNYSVALCREC